MVLAIRRIVGISVTPLIPFLIPSTVHARIKSMSSYEHSDSPSSRYDYNFLPYDPYDPDPGKFDEASIELLVQPSDHNNNNVRVQPEQRSPFSFKTFFTQCIVPPLLGLGYVGFGFYLLHTPTPFILSHSTANQTIISTTFIALASIWHFLALIPIFGLIDSVKSEEWWRRLLRSAPFARVNSVSSNFSGVIGYMGELVLARTSPYFKVAWILTTLAVITGDIAPGAIHVAVSFTPTSAAYAIPALLPDSIYADYAQPFTTSDDFVYASVDIAPIYINAIGFDGVFVTARPSTLNALIPRPTVRPGQGYRYLTDV